MDLNESYRRNSGNRDLDANKIIPYYGVTYVFGSFTDNGDFEINKSLDDRLDRPRGVLAYPINDMVGRRIKTSAMYARIFRFKYHNANSLVVSQYSEPKLKKDYDKIISHFIDDMEFVEVINILFTKLETKERSAFGKLWEITRQISKIDQSLQWEEILTDILDYESIYDDRGLGKIVLRKTPVLLVFDASKIDTAEIVEILKDKPEINNYIMLKIERMNNLADISNTRRRIKK